MFCSKCGAKADKKSEFCSECGATLKNEVSTTTTVVKEKSSSSSFAWGILGFFIPLAGLILFIVWNKDRKSDAKAAGIGALIRVIVNAVLIIAWILICFSLGFNEGLEGIYF